jgi:hypothetical protein
MIHGLAFFFSLTVFFSLTAHAQVPPQLIQDARAKNLGSTEEWRRLLHYHRSVFGSFTSEASGMNFFVAPNGRTKPQDELEATLTGFFSNEKRALDGVPAQTVRCQFPLRYRYLNRELGLDRFLPAQECKEWEEFRDRVAAKSATLVFSSFYAGNPSSTFGHSLLRLNKSDGSNGSDHQQLLDYGVN